MKAWEYINKKNLIILAKVFYFSIALIFLYRFCFVDTEQRGLIAVLLFFYLGFPLSLFWTAFIILPLTFINWISGDSLSMLPDFFQVSVVVLVCFANFCAGYRQWFVIVPKWVARLRNSRATKH